MKNPKCVQCQRKVKKAIFITGSKGLEMRPMVIDVIAWVCYYPACPNYALLQVDKKFTDEKET